MKVDWSMSGYDDAAEVLIELINPMEALLETHIAEIEALSKQIRSPRTPTEQRIEAVNQRDLAMASRKTLFEEVSRLRTRLRTCIERNGLEIGGSASTPNCSQHQVAIPPAATAEDPESVRSRVDS